MGYRGGYRPNYNKQNQRREPQPSSQSQQQQQQDQGNRTASGSDEPTKIQDTTVTLSLANSSESISTTSVATVEQSSTQGENSVGITEPAMTGIFSKASFFRRAVLNFFEYLSFLSFYFIS